jgi:hypothetical protein
MASNPVKLLGRKSQALGFVVFNTDGNIICLALVISIEAAPGYFARAHAGGELSLGVGRGFVKRITHSLHAVPYGDCTGMTFVLQIVHALRDCTLLYFRHFNFKIHYVSLRDVAR